ncbi:MAG: VWA domain-containing protein [Thermoanaerobaculia bacterium]
MKTSVLLAVCLIAAGLALPANSQETEPPAPLLLILDASGSMWGQIQGENKIVIARRVVGSLVDDLTDDQEIGLIAYGHRREGDCNDIETVLPTAALDRDGFKSTVNGLNPKGKTPITKSVKQALAMVEESGAATTVILVSDGLETCGADPCAAVKLARDQGLDFVMHVVGFDVAGEDTSSLQCAAQAGEGLFLSAENAAELGDALERAVAMSADVPAGRLAVTGIMNGELFDVGVVVTDLEGEMVAGARTYTSPQTNPSSIPLPDGVFDVKVQAIGINGNIERGFRIEINEGSTVERTEDFSTGEISVSVTRNGELSDAVYNILIAGTREEVGGGRTYTGPTSNPAVTTITAGEYEVEVGSVEIRGRPRVQLGRVIVKPGERVELSHEYSSGTLKIKAHRSGSLVDATVQVYGEDGKSVGGGRTYTQETSNPKTFVVEPGSYRIVVQEIRGPRTEGTVTVDKEAVVEKAFDFDSL